MMCPDFDYCSTCYKSVNHIHPGHRFVPIYESLSCTFGRSEPKHFGIRCDGPLCHDKMSYITGVRYKCAVCHDTDFCANCEALPSNQHNRTHPLIKFRTPVRNVVVTTHGEKDDGEPMEIMGDRIPQTRSKSTETTPTAPSANAATQVQTIAEFRPSPEPIKEEIVEKAPVEPKIEAPKSAASSMMLESRRSTPAPSFDAHFVQDRIADGSKLPADFKILQTWQMRNPGPLAWPAGCRVHYVGGDNMLNVDYSSTVRDADLNNATQSNGTSHAVAPGGHAFFSIMIKTPMRPGKAISYWRLKTAEGVPFGHKLWCDIDVEESKLPEQVQESSPKEQEPEPESEKPVEEVKEVEEMEKSQMIFPTLEKESPETSAVFEEKPTSPESVKSDDNDLFEEVENVELEDDETTDDGFLTDEEYEILDNESNAEEIDSKN